ncbi:MAG: HEAT repeat domain-containing protein [Candidatus Riflebacteria bacterium]|nr:HEAT repeat domain-containing protein [Candidatus Riflebacteria bacterium]
MTEKSVLSGGEASEIDDRFTGLVAGVDSEDEEKRKLCLTWLAQLGTPEALPHLQRLGQDPSPSVRQVARQLAGELRERLELSKEQPWGVDPAALIGHPDPRARLAGAMICYKKQSPQLKTMLVDRLKVEDDPFVRASLVKALRHYPDPAVIELLADCLLDPDARVRSNTIEALMTYEHPALFKRISNLLHDPDNRVRGTVLVYLARRSPEKMRPLLESMLGGTESWARRTARFAFKALGWEVPPEPEVSDSARDVLQMFASEEFEVRIQGIWRALVLPRDERLILLRNHLSREKHPHVVATLVRALGSCGQAEDLSGLSRYLESDDPRIRANAVDGIAQVGSTAALTLIERMLDDPAPRVRSVALHFVEKLRRHRSRAIVRFLLDSDKPDELASGLLEISRLPAAEWERVLQVVKQAWGSERQRLVAELLDKVVLHGPAQKLVQELKALCQAGCDGRSAGADDGLRGGSRRSLADLGAEALRAWEREPFASEVLGPDVAEAQGAEEAIARGVQVHENIQIRHRALERLGRAVAELVGRGEIENRSLQDRVETLKRAQAPPRTTPAEEPGQVVSSAPAPGPRGAPPRTGSGASPGPRPSSPLPAESGRAQPRASGSGAGLPAESGPIVSVAQSAGGGWGWAWLVVTTLALVGLGAVLASSHRPADTASRPAEKRPSKRLSPGPSPVVSPRAQIKPGDRVTWVGKVVEISHEGKRLVLEAEGRAFVAVFHTYPRVDPKINQLLEVTGCVSPRSGPGQVHLVGESFAEVASGSVN